MNNIKVSPDPLRDYVLITGLKGNEIISIYDAAGKKIFHTKSLQRELRISTAAWINGFYLIYITDTEGNLSAHKIGKTE